MPVTIILSLTALQILIVFVHLAVYETIVTSFGIHSASFAVLFGVLSFTFLSGAVLAHRFHNPLVKWYYAFAAYWFGLAGFLFGAAVSFFITANIFYAFFYVSPGLIAGVFLGAFFLLHAYGTWVSFRAETTNVRVSLANLPASWHGKKIVFVSDFHLGDIHDVRFSKKVAENMMALAPEAIFIGGDLYDGVRCNLTEIIEPLRALKAPQGVYFVTGNHDYYLPNPALAFEAIRGLGIRILDNEKISLDGIEFIGIDYKTSHKKKEFKKILDTIGVVPGRPNVLIKHEPDHLDVLSGVGINLGFFGHTHHGQIFPLNYLTRRIYRGFDYGLKQFGDAIKIYTSSGVGTWGPPLRLGTKSEIVLVEFV